MLNRPTSQSTPPLLPVQMAVTPAPASTSSPTAVASPSSRTTPVPPPLTTAGEEGRGGGKGRCEERGLLLLCTSTVNYCCNKGEGGESCVSRGRASSYGEAWEGLFGGEECRRARAGLLIQECDRAAERLPMPALVPTNQRLALNAIDRGPIPALTLSVGPPTIPLPTLLPRFPPLVPPTTPASASFRVSSRSRSATSLL